MEGDNESEERKMWMIKCVDDIGVRVIKTEGDVYLSLGDLYKAQGLSNPSNAKVMRRKFVIGNRTSIFTPIRDAVSILSRCKNGERARRIIDALERSEGEKEKSPQENQNRSLDVENRNSKKKKKRENKRKNNKRSFRANMAKRKRIIRDLRQEVIEKDKRIKDLISDSLKLKAGLEIVIASNRMI